MEAKDRWNRLQKEVENLTYGLDAFSVKLLEDGKWLIILERCKKRYPSRLDIHDAVDQIGDWGFGKVGFADGDATKLIETKNIKL